MTGAAQALQGRLRIATAPLSVPSVTAPAVGEVLARVEWPRRELHTRLIGFGEEMNTTTDPAVSLFVVDALLEGWAGDEWRDAMLLALLDALDVFHLLGPTGALCVLETGGSYRAAIIRMTPPASPTDPNVSVLGMDPRVDGLQILAADVRCYGVVTSDGDCYASAYALTRENTGDTVYRWTAEDAQPLPAALLARAVSSAWRTPLAQTPLTLGAALPSLRSTFKRYLLTFARERLADSRALSARERLHWADDSAYASRLAELKDLLQLAGRQFGDLYIALRRLRDDATAAAGPAYVYDTTEYPHKWRPNASVIVKQGKIDETYERGKTSLDVARARFLIHLSRNEDGAVGLVPREDVFDGASERTDIEVRTRALARLDDLIATADKRLADIDRELAEYDIDRCRFYKELLGTQPVTDVALQLGFGMDVLFRDALGEEDNFKPWALVEPARQDVFYSTLLMELIGEPMELQDSDVVMLIATVAVTVPASIVGLLTGLVWIPLVAAALSLGIDAVDLYLKYDRIADRSLVVHAVHGLPGYRDPELVRDFTIAAVLAALSAAVDLLDAVFILRRLSGIVSLDHRFAAVPGLRKAAREQAERTRVGYNAATLGGHADVVQAASLGRRFPSIAAAEAWASDFLAALSNPSTYTAGRAAFLEAIDQRGGWVAVEAKLVEMGANTARDQLYIARKAVIDMALSGRVVDQSAPGMARALTLTSGGNLDSQIDALKALRGAIRGEAGDGWAHRLGLSAHLVVSEADKPAAVQKLRNAWPGAWIGATPPSAIDGALQEFAELMSEGFGGWAALGKQLDDSLPEVTELRKLRDERLYPYLAQNFLVRKGGSENIASDLDVSVMFEVGSDSIKSRMDGVREFFVRATGLSDPHAWRNAFDMEVFVDPSLANFYSRLPDNGSTYILAQHVFETAAGLTEIMRRGGEEPLLGFDLLAEYARRNPFPEDLISARLAPGGGVRTPRDTEARLLDKLDQALTEYDSTLAAFDAGTAGKTEVLDRARRISDVALAAAMNNDEAYFLAGATKSVMTLRDGDHLYKGVAVALDKLKRLHIEELHHTLDENWLAHVAPDVARVTDAGFDALPLVEKEARLGKAFFQLGKYGQKRAVGFLIKYGAELEFPAALVARAEKLVALGDQLKALRNSAKPQAILEVLGKLDATEQRTLELLRLADNAPPSLSDLGAAASTALSSGELRAARLAERAKAALNEQLAELVGPGLELVPPSGLFPAGSVLGDLQRVLNDAAGKPLLNIQRWLVEQLSPRFGRALAGMGDATYEAPPSAEDELRILGVTPPPRSDAQAPDGSDALDALDFERLGLDAAWQTPG